MKIAIGADHRGNDVRSRLCESLKQDGYNVQAMEGCQLCGEGGNGNGPGSGNGIDYPDIAWLVATAVARGEVERGVLICGSGIGMCIAANKVPGVRAALVHDEISADMSRRHNDANVICLSADMLGLRIIDRIVRKWLTTPFEGGRHARRVRKIEAIERGESPATVADESPSAVA